MERQRLRQSPQTHRHRPARSPEPAREAPRRSSPALPIFQGTIANQGVRPPLAGGKSLPAPERAYFEPRFRHDFSNVRLHADEQAASLASTLHARAFAFGNHIVLGAGQQVARIDDGRRVLAHELAHVVQQSSGAGALGVRADSAGIAPAGSRYEREAEAAADAVVAGAFSPQLSSVGATIQRAPDAGTPDKATLNEIERRYRDMITSARSKGYHVAADNLEHWLQGSGSSRTIGVAWLRGFSEVTAAEKTNQQRFEKSLTSKAKGLKDGATATFTDYWDRTLTASVTEELYYASGTSTLHSEGTFTLRRTGSTVTIDGVVNHHWFDPYDWHAGLGAYIPGFGSVSDSDALLLEKYRGARKYDMEADWQQRMTGSVTIRAWWFDSVSYQWTGP